MSREILDFDMHVHAETDKAILASLDGEKPNAVWLPKSQIEIDTPGRTHVVVTLPAWLAEDKGLV